MQSPGVNQNVQLDLSLNVSFMAGAPLLINFNLSTEK